LLSGGSGCAARFAAGACPFSARRRARERDLRARARRHVHDVSPARRARLARLASGAADSFRLLAMPAAYAAMLAVLERADLALPADSLTPDVAELAAALET